MNINNKLVVIQTKTGANVIVSDLDMNLVATIPDGPGNLIRARRMVDCYNLFLGIEDPKKYFKPLAPKEDPKTPEQPPQPLPYNGLKVGDRIRVYKPNNTNWGPTEVTQLVPNSNIIKILSIDGKSEIEIPASICKPVPDCSK